jgi:hypothetical protein
MDESTTRLLAEILQELKKLNASTDTVVIQLDQLEPLRSLTPLVERFAPMLDNPAARWAMRKKG